jgi:hypothetical protein
MRDRGHGAESEEGQRLAARLRRIAEELQEVEQQIEKAREIEVRLGQLADRLAAPAEGTSGDSLREVRSFLIRMEMILPGRPLLIPEESWTGRADDPEPDRCGREPAAPRSARRPLPECGITSWAPAPGPSP